MSLNSSVTKLRNIHEDLKRVIDEISIQNNASYLTDPIRPLWNQFNLGELRIDLLFICNEKSIQKLQELITDITENEFLSFVENGHSHIKRDKVVFRLFDEDHFPVKDTTSLPYMIKVLYCEPDKYDKEDLSYFIHRFAKESLLTFILPGEKEFQRWLKAEIQSSSWKVVLMNNEIKLHEEIKKLSDSIELINLIALNLATRKVAQAIDSTIENEYKDLSARRISVQNDHSKLKKLGNQRLGQNLFASLKENLQRSFTEFENGINTRFNLLTKNQPGSLYSFLMDEIDGIHSLEEISIGSETKFTISRRTLVDLEASARNGFEEHLKNDVDSLNDYLDITRDEIDKIFKENGLSGFNYSGRKLTYDEVRSSLDDQFHFEKQHESKGLKKGFMSFFSAVRQPYMIIIMIVGIIARIIPSLELWKQWWFILIIVLSLVGGLYFAIQSSKKKKEELESEELKKISQWLKAEYKRIFSNIEKEWKTKYIQHAKTEFSEMLLQSENELKEFQNQRVEAISDETNLTQRKIQTLESFDKKLKEAQRQKMKVETDLNSLGSELKQTFLKLEI